MRVMVFAVLLSGLIVASGVAPALGAQMEARLNPDTNSSPFKVIYQRTAFIEYPVGSGLSETLHGSEWVLTGEAGPDDPAVQRLMQSLNDKIRSDGSTASVTDLTVEYSMHLTGRDINTSMDFRVVLLGSITNYVITQDQLRTLVDLGWRGLSSDIPVVIDDIDVNIPINMLQTQEPVIYDLVHGTEAGEILSIPLINADFILEQPMTNWHFLFDPTGINVDASQFGMSDELAGHVLSSWTMGESSIREGIQVEREWHATITGNTHPTIPGEISYELRAVQSADQANLHVIGFGALDTLEGVEIAGITDRAPDDFATTSTGDFPVFIIYGMAALAAVGGGLFFVFSNRALKHEKQGQQGIDPSQLVGYKTSSASGGYQTNRGEAQLRDASDYQQTRSYYEQTESTVTETPSEPQAVDATCSCAMSAELGSECDCQMQGSCLCDSTCQCSSETCREYVGSL
ncbi:MAG: hypothetical protein J4G04_06685 [Nitrosopumilaceae archaeon]|nr:hypothetical protein [Nitrosopumilaceae archaeon]